MPALSNLIACRFAALYPELVRAAVIVEGLGPPDRGVSEGSAEDLQAEGHRLQETLSIPLTQRPLPSLSFAAERLVANNPRLQKDRAMQLARQGTERNTDGELIWAFDPRVSTVFVGLGPADSARYWSHVQCPACIVAGALSAEYWGRAEGTKGDGPGQFNDGELEARAASFANAELVRMEYSGHMVHFDEPDKLTTVTLEFLRKHL